MTNKVVYATLCLLSNIVITASLLGVELYHIQQARALTGAVPPARGLTSYVRGADVCHGRVNILGVSLTKKALECLSSK